ncbi:hypothetical protein DFH07DRAFT_572710 [Mycena maculata]|uniref:Uncharacterized protein n=1 Tax=Mycena maculata TaxID=230809 RepID=A0AAD7N622_9AGAR|nr:hypothetical protein DFH07DRAFT_572710 [Mycena maculata]
MPTVAATAVAAPRTALASPATASVKLADEHCVRVVMTARQEMDNICCRCLSLLNQLCLYRDTAYAENDRRRLPGGDVSQLRLRLDSSQKAYCGT